MPPCTPNPATPRFGLPRSTALTRWLLIAMLCLYVLQVLAENWLHLPVLDTLGWWSPGDPRFRPWQPLSSMLLNGPEAFGAVISWVMFYFFFPTAQQELGTRGTLRVLGVSTATAIVLALALQFVGALHGGSVFLGIHAQLAALLVIFGLTRPSATILLFFVLPIRASIVAWGTGLLSFLFLITRRDLGSAVAFCAWLGAVAEIAGRPRLTVAWLRWRLRRSSPRPGSSARFHVIDGGRKQDPPVFH